MSLNYFANNANIPLLNDDILRLNRLIKEAASIEGLLYAIIVDRQQIIKAHTDHTKIGETLQAFENTGEVKKDENVTYFNYTLPSGTHVLNLSRPVMFKDKELGAVHVGVSLDFINNLIRRETIFHHHFEFINYSLRDINCYITWNLVSRVLLLNWFSLRKKSAKEIFSIELI